MSLRDSNWHTILHDGFPGTAGGFGVDGFTGRGFGATNGLYGKVDLIFPGDARLLSPGCASRSFSHSPSSQSQYSLNVRILYVCDFANIFAPNLQNARRGRMTLCGNSSGVLGFSILQQTYGLGRHAVPLNEFIIPGEQNNKKIKQFAAHGHRFDESKSESSLSPNGNQTSVGSARE